MCQALKTFLENGKISQAAFGRLIGKSQAAVGRYCSGVRVPGRSTMRRIEDATCGLVKAADFYQGGASGAAASTAAPESVPPSGGGAE